MRYNYMSSLFEEEDETQFDLGKDRAAGMHAELCAQCRDKVKGLQELPVSADKEDDLWFDDSGC